MTVESKRQISYYVACASVLGLITLGLAWELWLAPLRPGGSWLMLKVLPLLLVVPGLLKRRLRTFQATSLLVWVYFAEGATRVSSDPSTMSQALAALEVALCLSLFWAVAVYAKSFKPPKVSQDSDLSTAKTVANPPAATAKEPTDA